MGNKKEYVRIEEFVREEVTYWQNTLRLTNWEIKVVFLEMFQDGDHLVVADTEAFWEYETATIRFFLPGLVRGSDEEIVRDVLHELVHVLNAPLESAVSDSKSERKELACERITRALLSTRDLD